MTNAKDVISLMVPLLHGCLNDQQVDELASRLSEPEYFSKELYKAIEERIGRDKIQVLVDEIRESSKRGWQLFFRDKIKEIVSGNIDERLVKILECCLIENARPHYLWILTSWDKLLEMENTIKNQLNNMLKEKYEGDQFLLEFAYRVCLSESETEVNEIIETVKNAMSHMSPVESMGVQKQAITKEHICEVNRTEEANSTSSHSADEVESDSIEDMDVSVTPPNQGEDENKSDEEVKTALSAPDNKEDENKSDQEIKTSPTAPPDNKEVSRNKRTYADVTAGNSAGESLKGAKNNEVEVDYDKIRENHTYRETNKIFTDFMKLAKSGKYMLEFQAIIDDDYKLPDNATLMLYLDSEKYSYAMDYNAMTNTYHCMMEVSCTKISETYKFWVKKSESLWEYLPVHLPVYGNYWGIWNRKIKIEYDQISRGHALVFDIIILGMFYLSEEAYQFKYLKNFSKFLPPLSLISLNDEDGGSIDVVNFLNTCLQWLKSCHSGVTMIQNGSGYCQTVGSGSIRDYVVSKYIRDESAIQYEGTSCVKRVVGMLIFSVAMQRKDVSFNNNGNTLKTALCNCLSVHDVDEKDLALLLDKIAEVASYHDAMKIVVAATNFKVKFKEVFKNLQDVPESFLVLPLLNIVLNSKVLRDWNWNLLEKQGKFSNMMGSFRNMLTLSNNQLIIEQMADKILLLSSRFPWLCKMYAEAVNLQSVVKLLSNDQLSQFFDIDLMFGKILYFGRQLARKSQARDEILNEDVFVTLQSYIMKLLKDKVVQLGKESSSVEKCDSDSSLRWLKRANELVEMQKKHTESNEQCLIGYISHSMNLVDGVLEIAQMILDKHKREEIETQSKVLQYDLLECVRAMVCAHQKKHLSEHTVELWNMLAEITWSDNDFTKRWLEKCCDSMKKALPHKIGNKADDLLKFFEDDFERFKLIDPVQDCFTEVIVQCVEEKLHDPSHTGNLIQKLQKKITETTGLLRPKLLQVCLQLFSKQWHRLEDQYGFVEDDHVLDYFEKWKPGLLRIICIMKKQLSSDVFEMIEQLGDSVVHVINTLTTGSITVSNLHHLHQVKKVFLESYTALQSKELSSSVDYTPSSLGDLIALRHAELRAFQDTRRSVQDFCEFASSLVKDGIAVNMMGIDQQLNVEVAKTPLNKLVQCRTYHTNHPVDDNNHTVTFFHISQEDMVSVKTIHEAVESKIILGKLREASRLIEKDELTIKDLLEQAWPSVVASVKETVKKINNGTIKLCVVHDLFEQCLVGDENNMDRIRNELQNLWNVQRKTSGESEHQRGQPQHGFNKRVSQISNYFKIQHHLNTAQILENIRVILKLNGDFDGLTQALEMREKADENELCSINEKMVQMTRMFQDITPEKLINLQEFVQCETLIVWLKNNMKHTGEVKVMSDLAMILAGETPKEIDRVSLFLSAVMGFSPLLFDLQPNSGLDKMLKACKEVWRNLERDKDLLINWIATSKQLNWLDTIKDFNGSVEKSSLTRAQMINTEGVYEVGGDSDIIPNIESCLSLFIAQDDQENIVMTLSELRDLQSRLMLIAGEAEKGKQDVTHFMKTLSAVENLAKEYVKLKRSGCALFTNWKATVNCRSNNDDHCMTVQVYFDEKSPAISSSEDVLEEVKNLTDILRDAHTDWINYLNEKRSEFYSLNYFNIHQLIYLCKELAGKGENSFQDQVYTLLIGVAENITFEKIVDYLDDATKVEENEQDDAQPMEENETLTEMQRKKKVVRKLVQLGLSENIAKAAVQVADSLDVDECYLWGLAPTEDIDHYQQEFDADAGFETMDSNISAVQNIIDDRSNLTLKQVIQHLQNDLGDTSVGTAVKTICERYFKGTAITSLDDCISLTHLGKFLDMLGSSVEQCGLPNRNWPNHFNTGRPNMIVCAEADMWQTVLSVYMASPDEVLPLASEVFICCDSTTPEEIELLLRRAISKPVDDGQRIFCLACANELPFNVAKETEETFQHLIQMSNKNDDYRLVIITSSLQHYLTSCFDEHQVDGKFSLANISTEDYLRRHLFHSNEAESAAMVDPEQCAVRVVSSEAAGMGKSLFISRRHEDLSHLFEENVRSNTSTIRFLEQNMNMDDVINSLNRPNDPTFSNGDPHFVHIDITPSIQHGVYKFLFDLVVLKMIQSSHGTVWRRRSKHYYVIEYTVPSKQGFASFTNLLGLLPSITCLSPTEVRDYLRNKPNQALPIDKVLMDDRLFRSEMYQRPYQYLALYAERQNLDNFTFQRPHGHALQCIDTLLNYCSIREPSWLELSHFSRFLNTQLHDCENSVFCNLYLVGADSGLHGFKKFVVRFMIRMAQDFATPSLNCDDDEDDNNVNNDNDLFELHQLRRRWENGFHPYLFFNHDRVSLSFVHFNINAQGALCHPKTDEVVEDGIMPVSLVGGLTLNQVNIRQDFDQLNRHEKLATLCQVFGVKPVFDPDPTYELTTDNVLKMLAIHMRFRCDIPVVVMGETGCGKTRMIEFMSKLKAGGKQDVRNMVIVKVHGGITVSIIQNKVREAVRLAEFNKENGNGQTILFLDEANTTEAIYAIKEIVCDRTVHGEPFSATGLNIVAACNPYRKHSDDVIRSMEKSGLGFHVKAQDTSERFAGIPMRQLVYRVISLPPSMQPLVWDFGQLNDATEAIYIEQMVLNLEKDIDRDEELPSLSNEMRATITNTLTASQCYMRRERDVCSFVSLRDVERAILSFKWFYKQGRNLLRRNENQKDEGNRHFEDALWALIQALGMCYHATLNERKAYRKVLSTEISRSAKIKISEKNIGEEIVDFQKVFINAIELDKDIARNEALRENVFMIIVCVEMRIPLFLVGKPGSSKSLAKTIVADAMQGRNSRSALFRQLKEIHVLSFQCSAVSDAVGIETVFSQCSQLQKKRDVHEYVATVVLDEIGLAEDSPKMPLKVLHPLLESASTSSTLLEEQNSKVGFVGISNWALDPAKMNRGIFVTRGEPSERDLHRTAKAIFESDTRKFKQTVGLIKALTNAYLKIYKTQEREFFGLRDYYGLLKMLFAKLSQDKALEFNDVAIAVMRNFSGYSTDVFKTFQEHCMKVFPDVQQPHMPVTKLIHSNLNADFESRFLLLLTNQYSAVSLLPMVMGKITEYQVIFGSSFPHDHDYTEVCKNINRIKVCMESGRAVVLLNLRDLYESLYDALNQQYVTLGAKRYVDLGLGGHRVKCRVAQRFRLIVIEEKEVVYNEFAIPLINRLEKFIFEMSSVLSPNQVAVVKRLHEWVTNFSTINAPRYAQWKAFAREDAFAGYKDDTPASALLSISSKVEEKYECAKRILLQTASLDSVCRLPNSNLNEDSNELQNIYMNDQHHDTLWKMLMRELQNENQVSVFEITSFSQVLNEKDRRELENLLNLGSNRVMLITLQQFQTEQQYSDRLDEFFAFTLMQNERFDEEQTRSFVLLIQCPQAHLHENLIACAKYSAMNKVKEFKLANPDLDCTIIMAFIFTLERNRNFEKKMSLFTSFHSQECSSVYIDELRPGKDHIAPVSELWNLEVSDILTRRMKDKCLIDIHRLISESIPQAMAKLRNQTQTSRNRVQILVTLCFKSKVADLFLHTMLQRIIALVQDRERKFKEQDYWIVEKSCSSQALQEGGSLRNTLWLHLRKLVALMLAKVVSIIDADHNLDLIENLENGNRDFADIWFRIFNSNVCEFHWSGTMRDTEFVVCSKPHFSCQFPFFRVVYDILYKQWMVVLDRNIEDRNLAFVQKIENTALQGVLDKAIQRNGMLTVNRFIHDLVHLIHTPCSQNGNMEEEYEVVQDCCIELFKLKRKNGNDHHNSLVEVFILLMDVLTSLEQFAEITAIRPDIIDEKEHWITEQCNSTEFVLHVSAFTTLLHRLESEAPQKIGSIDACVDWKSCIVKVKHISEQLIPSSNEQIQRLWKQLVFVEIFLDQLIPSSASVKKVKLYVETLAPLARRLWIGSGKSKDMSNFQFLNIVTHTLQNCTKEIHLRLLCSGRDIKCRACKTDKLTNPVLLPCRHYVCFKCLSQKPDSSCQICRIKIPNPGGIKPLCLTTEQQKELENFKLACTSFFLEYLSTFCFPLPQLGESSNMPPPENTVTHALQKLVICDEATMDISPHLSNFDTNPTARSYILQLLLRCDADRVEHMLEEHLTTMATVLHDKGILMEIYIQCVQDMIQNRSNFDNGEMIINTNFAHNLLHECTGMSRRSACLSQIKHLDLCAKLQFIASVTASCIVLLENKQACNKQTKQQMLRFTRDVCKACMDPDYIIMRQFLIKFLCRQHGMDAFDRLLNNNLYRHLIPQNLLPGNDDGFTEYYLQSDLLVLSGGVYIRTKASLLEILGEADLPQIFEQITNELRQSPENTFQILLAVSVWAAHDLDNELRQNVFIEVQRLVNIHPHTNSLQQFFRDISRGSLRALTCDNESQQMQYKLRELVIMFGAALLHRGEGILSDLRNIILHPDQLFNSFLPTMPASSYFAVRQVMGQGNAWHFCPNGHPYFIGECGRPLQAAVCNECRAQIGGLQHRLFDGNNPGQITEQSQAGYKLGVPERSPPAVPERKLTKLSVCATRICLHTAMMLGARRGDAVARMINPGMTQHEVFSFLSRHIIKDLKELSTCIGRSIDDTFIVIHQIFHQMLSNTLIVRDQRNCNFQTMDNRGTWEEGFQRQYLSVIFQQTDAVINAAQTVLIDAGKLAEQPLQRLVYELKPDEELPAGIVEWNCPNLWKYRIHVDMRHLRQRLEAVDSVARGEGAALKAILNVEHLELLCHLQTVVSLQSILITRYRQKIDMKDANEKTLQNYLDEENQILEDDIQLYIKIWNKIRQHHSIVERLRVPRDYTESEMNLQSPIAMCLPSRRGHGCCALFMLEYFVEMQNNLLHQCRELINPQPRFHDVDATQLTSNDIICINENHDLLPLVQANSQYEITTGEAGRRHNITYNLGLLEKKVMEKFILRKAFIKKETIPLMQYPQDMGLGKDFETVRNNEGQEQLPIKICKEIDAVMQNTMTARICEVVRTLTVVIQFLAKLGGENMDQAVCEYAEKELMLPSYETDLIPRSAKIRHCLALYERLSWHRSQRLIANGQNPFEMVLDTAEDIEDGNLIHDLREELARMNVVRLQVELNALLMVGPEMEPRWSLGEDALLNYLDGKYDSDNSWCEKIPEGILFKNAVHVFTLSLEFLPN